MPGDINKLVGYDDFSAGLQERSSIFADVFSPQAENYGLKAASDADNVLMGPYGLEKFPGYIHYLTAAISGTPVVTGLYEYKKTGSGAANFWIVCAGTKIFTATGGTVTEIFPLATGHTITAGVFFQFVTFNNAVIMLNGTDPPLYYDGTTCDRITFNDPSSIIGSATPAFAEIFRNRIFYSGDPTNPSRVWTPRPGSYSNFDNSIYTVDSFDVSVGDGQNITGLKAYTKDIMMIYKSGSIHRLNGSQPFGGTFDPFQINEVTREFGSIAPRTILQVGFDQFFLSSRGYKKLSAVLAYGDVEDGDPTYQLKDSILALNYTDTVISNSFAVWVPDQRHIYLHVPVGSGTQNTQAYVFDPITNAIMPRSGLTASCGAEISRQYYTGTYAGQIYKQLNGDNFDGAVIPSHWESKWLSYGNLKNKLNFRNLMIYFETAGTATITLQWQIMKMDGSIRTQTASSEAATSDVWGTGLWDTAIFDSGESTIFKKNNLGRGRAIKIRITNNNANERWKVRKIILGFQNRGWVGA